eukprot:TRINITY_DN1410_c0_g1_i1.p1 TRINITY_DN1410_c0_g1~~TRINITY_DN1410_c0_g1_i1.p1  ORF type:complete len:221 (-),score=91.77 TRINITY_DN1410_c0_g1_i1:394-999(-)
MVQLLGNETASEDDASADQQKITETLNSIQGYVVDTAEQVMNSLIVNETGVNGMEIGFARQFIMEGLEWMSFMVGVWGQVLPSKRKKKSAAANYVCMQALRPEFRGVQQTIVGKLEELVSAIGALNKAGEGELIAELAGEQGVLSFSQGDKETRESSKVEQEAEEARKVGLSYLETSYRESVQKLHKILHNLYNTMKSTKF